MTITQQSDHDAAAAAVEAIIADDADNTNNALQRRIEAFNRALTFTQYELRETKQSIIDLETELEAERAARSNAQVERDAVVLKLKAFAVLLQRVLDADATEYPSINVWIDLIEDIKAAMEVQS